jgi:hypothetical protein
VSTTGIAPGSGTDAARPLTATSVRTKATSRPVASNANATPVTGDAVGAFRTRPSQLARAAVSTAVIAARRHVRRSAAAVSRVGVPCSYVAMGTASPGTG